MKAKKKTLLWQFDRADLAGPCYVFGTMHARSAQVHQLARHVRPYLDACTAFAAEYDLSETSAGQPFDLSPTQPLDQLLGPRRFAKARKMLLKTAGLDIWPLRQLHPVLILSMLDERFFSQEHAQPLDMALWSYAGDTGKCRLGLESLSHQWELLQQIPAAESARSLWLLSRNPARHRRQMQQMMRHYLAGDPHALYREAKSGLGKYRRLFLYERNQQMTDRMLLLAAGQTLFAAVGAGHLSGEKGILRLLKKAGCRVQPVSLSHPQEQGISG